MKDHSLYNTPPTFGFTCSDWSWKWIAAEGGLSAIEKRNEAKAKLLYDTIDDGGYYSAQSRGFTLPHDVYSG